MLEIQTVVDEDNLNYAQIQQKFGLPEELAQSYLEDVANEPKRKKEVFYQLLKKG